MTLRTMLFVPADERRIDKLPMLAADAFVIDLEDAIPSAMKSTARQLARAAVQSAQNGPLIVRVNNAAGTGQDLHRDLDAVVWPGLHAVMLPKTDSADELDRLDTALAALEAERGLAPSSIKVFALVESARGVVCLDSIAAAIPSRLAGLVLGPADLAAELGLGTASDTTALAYVRARMVVAARAARLPSPIDGPYPVLHDPEGLAADSRRSRASGFQGRLVLHPDQVEAVSGAYRAAGIEDLELAQRIVAAYEDGTARGVGALAVGDLIVDEPVYRRYLAILDEQRDSLAEESAR